MRAAGLLMLAIALSACGDSPTELPPEYSSVVLDDDPIVYWRFEELTGTVAADNSGNSRAATYLETPTLGALSGKPRLGRAVGLDASADGVVSQSPTWSNMAAFSVEAWVNADVVTSSEGVIIVDKAETWNLFLDADGRPAVQFPGGEHKAQSATPLMPGQTYHLVGTQANGTFTLYVNGGLAAMFTSDRLIDVRSQNPIYVGRGLTGGFWEFRGTIDEVAIYDKVLTADAVLRHYNAGK